MSSQHLVPGATARYFIDTGVAIHLPQTNRIKGRKQARSIHGYLGTVLTRHQALAAEVPLCSRCFPHGFYEERHGE